ncbi:MAG: hypothetical protein QOD06_960 [Candidatus Binatota bacterium]|jgi:hypothetical protein|nr:hypothetical protein [Candidatus Binatota bacterium]
MSIETVPRFQWLRRILASVTVALLLLPASPAGSASPERGAAAAAVARVAAMAAAMETQTFHERDLLATPGVVAVGLGDGRAGGELELHVYRTDGDRALSDGLPALVGGLPVRVFRTNAFRALDGPPGFSHRQSFALPVPMGVSTGNNNGCSAGTLGFRVVRISDGVPGYVTAAHIASAGTSQFCPNAAKVGEPQFQPGLLDGSCAAGSPPIGRLGRTTRVAMSTDASNRVDASFVKSRRSWVDKYILDIGDPSPAIASPIIGETVQKSGRTTGLTQGTVVSTNVTLLVGYGVCGVAKFLRQIIVAGTAFVQPGDSGAALLSLRKDRSGRYRPIGLIFAGSDQFAAANPIRDVMAALGTAIDTAD